METDNNFFITNTLTLKTSKYFQKTNKSLISNYKKNQKEEKEIMNENFLDYLINNQSNYANFEKITEYYEEKLRKNEKKFNENLKIIKQKKEEIQNLKITINNSIANNISLTNKNLDIYYSKIIEKIKNDILLREHELEIYKKLYNDIYKHNYRLNSKLETENKLSKISEEQHEKYLHIKDVSLNKLLKQEEMLKTLNYYFNKCKESNEILVNQKKEEISKLNYEIYMLKKDEIIFENNIEEIKDKSNKINKIILEKQKQFGIIINDYKYILKHFYKDDISMNQIYEILGVIDVDNILSNFKKLRQKYNELSLHFSFKSKQIISINEELTNLDKEYNNILNGIKNKKNMENGIKKKINYNEYLEEIKGQIEAYKPFFEEKMEIFKNKIELISKCIFLILITIDKIINSINNSKYKDIFKRNIENDNNRDLLIKNYQKYYKDNIANNKKINYEKDIVNKKFLKFIIFILKELNYRIRIITNIIYKIICKKAINIKTSKKSLSENNKNNNSPVNKDLYISSFNNNYFKNIFKNELKMIKNKLEEKKKFYEGKENKHNNNNNNNNNSKDKRESYYLPSIDRDILVKNKSMDYISKKDFLYNYYIHYKNTILNRQKRNEVVKNNTFYVNNKNNFINNEFNISSNFFNVSTKYNDSDSNKINLNKFNFAISYTNDFVSDKKEIEAKKIEKYEKIFKKSKSIRDKVEREEFLKYLKKKGESKKIPQLYHSQNDISIDSNEQNENEIREEIKSQIIHQELMELKKPKKFNLKYENQEIGKIFERYDDIRALELQYFKNHNKYLLDSSFFNEYYFKLKKQFYENRMKTKLRDKFLRHSNSLFYKINNKNNNNISSRNININKNSKTIYNTMRTSNKKNLHKSNSQRTIINYNKYNIRNEYSIKAPTERIKINNNKLE